MYAYAYFLIAWGVITGTGLGGLVGGLLYDVVGGKKTFLIVGAVMGGYATVFLGVYAFLTRCGHSGTQGGE